MEDEGQQLLDRILDEPDNLDLRLVFADWLDEHDEYREVPCVRCRGRGDLRPFINVTNPPQAGWKKVTCVDCNGLGTVRIRSRADWASFMRLQIRHEELILLSESEVAPGESPYETLSERRLVAMKVKKLFDRYKLIPGSWAHPVPEWERMDRNVSRSDVPDFTAREGALRFAGGFVHTVWAASEGFEKHALKLFSAHPVRRVRVIGTQPRYVVTVRGPRFQWVRSGTRTWTYGGEIPAKFFDSGPLTVPRSLDGDRVVVEFLDDVRAIAWLSEALVRWARNRAGLKN